MTQVPLPAEDFVMGEEALYVSHPCTASPATFPNVQVAKLIELTGFETTRLIEKSRRLKVFVEEYLLEAQTFLYPMVDATQFVISERNKALASLDQARKDNQWIVSALQNKIQAQEAIEKALEVSESQFEEELAKKNPELEGFGIEIH